MGILSFRSERKKEDSLQREKKEVVFYFLSLSLSFPTLVNFFYQKVITKTYFLLMWPTGSAKFALASELKLVDLFSSDEKILRIYMKVKEGVKWKKWILYV